MQPGKVAYYTGTGTTRTWLEQSIGVCWEVKACRLVGLRKTGFDYTVPLGAIESQHLVKLYSTSTVLWVSR